MQKNGNPPRISVIIPNRDGKVYLKKCLDSLLRQSLEPFEIIVIDDASTDKSIEYLKINYSSVITIPSANNKTSLHNVPQGFSGAVNAGINIAKGNYIALLNNDTEVGADWLLEMFKTMEKYPEAASVSCKMYLKDGKHINALGLMLEKGGSCRTIADGVSDEGQFEEEVEIFGPSGGAALWRKDVLDKIGIFEHDYFAYYEDADLAFRARAAGYISIYSPKSKIIHLEGRCPSLARFDKVALRLRNAFWFVWSNFPAAMLIKNLPGILWETFFRHMFKYGPRLWKVEGRSFWKAAFGIFKTLPRIIKMRKTREKNRKIPCQELQIWLGNNPFEKK